MSMAGLRNFIQELDKKQFYQYISIFFAGFCILLGILVFFQRRSIAALDLKLKRVNQQREEARSILQEHVLINEQRAAVDAILAKDKNFKIPQYFDLLVKELGLTSHMSKVPTVVENDLNNGYEEVQLDSSFKDMNMKQVAELLYKIEKNDRVYTKELILIKQSKAPLLDVTLVIATLQPKLTS